MEQKKIVVLGAGESGAGAAVLAKVKDSTYLCRIVRQSRRNISNFSTAMQYVGKRDIIPNRKFSRPMK